MVTSHSVIQGYNGIAVEEEKKQVITHADASGLSTEYLSLKAMIDGARETMNLAEGDTDALKNYSITADASFHSSDGLEWIEEEKN